MLKKSNELIKRLPQTEVKSPGATKIYIASPLRADTAQEQTQNMLYARKLQSQLERLGYKAIAPHAWLPMVLDDSVPKERRLALSIGQKILKRCDAVLVAGNRVSSGMMAEIATAKAQGIPVIFYTAEAQNDFARQFTVAKEELV